MNNELWRRTLVIGGGLVGNSFNHFDNFNVCKSCRRHNPKFYVLLPLVFKSNNNGSNN